MLSETHIYFLRNLFRVGYKSKFFMCSLSQLLSQIENIRRMKVTFSDIFGISQKTHTKSASNI